MIYDLVGRRGGVGGGGGRRKERGALHDPIVLTIDDSSPPRMPRGGAGGWMWMVGAPREGSRESGGDARPSSMATNHVINPRAR